MTKIKKILAFLIIFPVAVIPFCLVWAMATLRIPPFEDGEMQ